MRYHLELHTGNQHGADSEVHVQANLLGTRGDTGMRKLLQAAGEKPNRTLFAMNQVGPMCVYHMRIPKYWNVKVLIKH